MSQVLELMRPELINLKPYDAGRAGIDDALWLDANESPWGDFNRYIFDIPMTLKEQLASLYQVNSAQILLTRGSSEGIDLLVRLFCVPYQDSVMICPPTFTLYAQSALVQGAKIVNVPLLKEKDFSLDMTAIKENLKNNIKIIFLCTPNNPTGNIISINEIVEVLEMTQGKTIVVVDEAYIEFSQSLSVVTLIEQYPNLVVLRTLSKAFGMASLRCGVVIANRQITQSLAVILPPCAFSTLVLEAAIEGTRPEKILQLKKQVQEIVRQKNELKAQLLQLPFVVRLWDSEANFLLVQFQDAKAIYENCCRQGIYLRDVSSASALNNCLRISIGDQIQNARLIKVMAQGE